MAIVADNTYLGGINQYCLALAEGARALPDVEITLLSPHEDEPNVWLIEEAERRGLDLELLPMRGTFDFTVLGKLGRTLRERQVDIVHAQGYRSSVISHVTAALYRLPVRLLCTAHGLPAFRGPLQPMRWYVALDLLVKRACDTPVVAVSHDTRLRLMRRGLRGERVIVVPNGVDMPATGDGTRRRVLQDALGLDPARQTIGFVGRLDIEKGVDVLAGIAEEVFRRRSDVQLLVVGDGPCRDVVEDLAAAFPRRVLLAGVRHDMDGMYRLIDVLLLPAQEGEGMPFAVLEAMSYGIPCVVSRIAGTAEVIEDQASGFLLVRGDREGMVRKALCLLDDVSLRQRMGQRARERVEAAFTRQRMCERTFEIYRALASGRPDGG